MWPDIPAHQPKPFVPHTSKCVSRQPLFKFVLLGTPKQTPVSYISGPCMSHDRGRAARMGCSITLLVALLVCAAADPSPAPWWRGVAPTRAAFVAAPTFPGVRSTMLGTPLHCAARPTYSAVTGMSMEEQGNQGSSNPLNKKRTR